MQKPRRLGILPLSLCILVWAAGCSHANFNFGGGGGAKTAPMLLTFHDTPAAGITVTSFEVTVSGAVLQPGNVSLLASPQTIELTQLQTNSAFLSTTNVPVGTYTSLTITYASPQYTFLNDSGVSVTAGGQTCAAGASCVVTSPAASPLTLTLSSPSFPSLVVGATNQTLLEVDVNLNNIIQPNFSLNFGPGASGGSGAVTVTQSTGTGSPSKIGNFSVTGQVASVSTSPANQFTLSTPAGKTLTIKANAVAFEFARANCTNNDFTCLAAGQIVDTNVDIFSDGSLSATEVDFDDASGTQQVSGTIVTENNSPPTSFQMIVHNTIPPVVSLPPGTPVTVNIGGAASFVINNGSFVLPIGTSFASASDVIVGQEVEARVASGTSISNGAFTADRLALEQTQLEANVSSISPQAQPFPFFVFNPLPPLFTQASVGPATQLQVDITGAGQSGGTIFENLTPLSLSGVTVAQKVTAGGFLFNTTGTVGSPTIVATTVRGEVPGT